MALIDAVSIQNSRTRGQSAVAKFVLEKLGSSAVGVFLEARNQEDATKKPEQHITDILRDYRDGKIMNPAALEMFARRRKEFKDKFDQVEPSQWQILLAAACKDSKSRLMLLARPKLRV